MIANKMSKELILIETNILESLTRYAQSKPGAALLLPQGINPDKFADFLAREAVGVKTVEIELAQREFSQLEKKYKIAAAGAKEDIDQRGGAKYVDLSPDAEKLAKRMDVLAKKISSAKETLAKIPNTDMRSVVGKFKLYAASEIEKCFRENSEGSILQVAKSSYGLETTLEAQIKTYEEFFAA